MKIIVALVAFVIVGKVLLSILRKFADPTGGRWLNGYRDSTWVEIGELNLDKYYANVSFSEESCTGLGNTSAACILRSVDTIGLQVTFFAVLFNFEDDYNHPNTIRIMNIRREDLIKKYIDEQFVSAKFTKFDGLNIPFSDLQNLSKKTLAKVKRLSKKHGITYSTEHDKWFNKTFVG